MFIFSLKIRKGKLLLWILLAAAWAFLLHLWDPSLLFPAYAVCITDQLTFRYPSHYQVECFYPEKKPVVGEKEAFVPFLKTSEQIFTDYSSEENGISFKYPSGYTLEKIDLPGGEILSHLEFRHRENTSRGLVQVWALSGSLEEFLENAKKYSQQDFRTFSSKKIIVNGVKGCLWEYTAVDSNGLLFKGMEAFLNKDKKMYRLSLFAPVSHWTENLTRTFYLMLESFRIH